MRTIIHRILSTVILALSALLLSSCQSARNAVYCIGEDLTDIVVAEATFSFGTDMGAHVMATEFLQAKAYSYEDLYSLGIRPRQLGLWKSDREGWNLSLAHSRNMRMNQAGIFTLTPAESLAGKAASKNGAKALMMESVDEFGIGAHLFVIGGHLGIRPLEIIDLFANLIGLDPLHDNLEWMPRRALRAAKKASGKPPPLTEEGLQLQEPAAEAEALQEQMLDLQRQVEAMQRQMMEVMQSMGTP